jgi:uncharacterized protein
MLFNVSGLMLESTGATRFHEFSGTLHTTERPPERLTGRAHLLRTPNGILVRAHVDLVEPESCSRCLEPLEEKVSLDFEEEFQAQVDPRTGNPLPADERDADAFTIDENHMLDLTEAVRQYREASADMQPLCREDCLGLCPRCGANLNLGDCNCEKGNVDSRWAVLADLRLDADGKD